ncbi:DEKNAAC105524 [Brettanomyces naardenensis]|uniref:Autophagy-related protein 14 n=1 Tax=Brettanomyces naardenensis TaxID=13370 RepID=A0A448YTU5_BRENA|nr:DEKNAAC105524 [Brettanomyces naardenensis]
MYKYASNEPVPTWICGVCHDHEAKNLSLLKDKTYYCASCMSYRLLKLRIDVISTLYYNTRVGNEVERVLDDCLNNEARVFLTNYLDSDKGEAGKMSQTCEIQVSVASVARLAHVLLNVENAEHFKRLKQLKSLVESKRKENEAIRHRIAELKNKVKVKDEALRVSLKGLDNNYGSDKPRASHLFESSQELVLGKQQRMVDNFKLDLVCELANFWNVHLLWKNVGSCISLLGSPILSAGRILHYNVSLVNSGMDKLLKFIMLMSKYLGIELPFPVITKDGVLVLRDTSQESLYWVLLPLVNENKEPLISLLELKQDQLRQFSGGLARMIVNMVRILIILDPRVKLDALQISDLLKMDELFALIVKRFDDLEAQRDRIREEKREQTRDLRLLKRGPAGQKWKAVMQNNTERWWFWKRAVPAPIVAPPSKKTSREFRKTGSDPLCYQLLKTEKVDLLARISVIPLNDDMSSSVKSATSIFGASVRDLMDDTDFFASKLYGFFTSEIVRAVESYTMTNTTTLTMDSSSSSGYQQVNIPLSLTASKDNNNNNNNDQDHSNKSVKELKHSSTILRKEFIARKVSNSSQRMASKRSNIDNWEFIDNL